jgi:hypothetical protein
MDPLRIAAIVVLLIVAVGWAMYEGIGHWHVARSKKLDRQRELDARAQRQRELELENKIRDVEDQNQIMRDEIKRLTFRNKLFANELRADGEAKTECLRPSKPYRMF